MRLVWSFRVFLCDVEEGTSWMLEVRRIVATAMSSSSCEGQGG